MRWTNAARFADRFPTEAAILAVTVVPMFSPSTMAAASSNEIHPWFTMTNVSAMVALDDWITSVRMVPTARKMSTDPKPRLV